ncbi:isochorismatase family protein [Shewanella sp. VB17]|uniref:isochorismatase family protein n=1 Tax=Shewanella sp. VB17 TaxID=2739432 RepID=UPI00156775BF|nr:isochorismatase family protein [Shewanella sp. VB17]NRD73047.1 isochorismatase family protein [Shewanella sp. VB17]
MISALLVVDAQNGVFGSSNPPYLSENVIENMSKLISYANSRKHKTVFIQHEIPGVLEPESDAWKIVAGLNSMGSAVKIRKKSPDSFNGTDLSAYLDEEGIEHVIICGYSTDFCIDRTAFSAASRGYQVTLIGDAHTTHSKPHLDALSIIDHHHFTLSKHPKISLVSTQEFTAD